MRTKGILAEDFVNYKLPSMFIAATQCDWKCCSDAGMDTGLCQNSSLASAVTTTIKDSHIFKCFTENPITKAVVIGGLEPFLQFDELQKLISYFRSHGENCDFVIYTGYYPDEIWDEIHILSQFKGIVIKFGRYIPGQPSTYDEVLGVTLASDNQYATRIS